MSRSSALFHGILVGTAFGSFGVGWACHHFYYFLADVARIAFPEDIQLMKASGDKALLLSIIVGAVLLAIGIGGEIYQRAKYGSKLSS